MSGTGPDRPEDEAPGETPYDPPTLISIPEDDVVFIPAPPIAATDARRSLTPPPSANPLDKHLDALVGHVSVLSRRSYGKGREFIERVIMRLEEAVGGPPSPSLWMLRELKRNPNVYLDRLNVLLTGKLAENAAHQLQLFDGDGRVPPQLLHEAYEVCQSVAENMHYRILGPPPE